jgi:hypothetical protein
MAEKTPAEKLLIRAGQRVAVLNAPAGYPAALGIVPDGVVLRDTRDDISDVVLLFVRDKAHLRGEIASAIAATAPGGLLWIVYAKQASKVVTDVNRDIIWRETQETGWRPVTQVALDDTWSALRFRPVADVKSRQR